MKIYVASSWRNVHQPAVVTALQSRGHDVYDFRNPKPGVPGFGWASVDREWQTWTLRDYLRALGHIRAEQGFRFDREALEWCDCCVLVLPSGASAHLEAGWCSGRKKPVVVYAPERFEPELMYKLFDVLDGITPAIHDSLDALLECLNSLELAGRMHRLR